MVKIEVKKTTRKKKEEEVPVKTRKRSSGKGSIQSFQDRFKEYTEEVVRQSKSKIGRFLKTQPIDESKPGHSASPVIQKFMEEERAFYFPSAYGENKIVLLVRDPYWIYSYWEITLEQIQNLRLKLKSEFLDQNLILRIFIVDRKEHFDLNVAQAGICGNWYIHAGRPNMTFYAQIGFITADGKFYPLATSNRVVTPRDGVSDIVDEEWFIPEWEKLFALSGGLNFGSGSFGLKELMEKRLKEQISSGGVSSFSSPQMGAPLERPFFLVADTELIVYGATEPTASLTVKGMPIKLRHDGSFTLRFALPNGTQNIPIEAIRDDGMEKRKITPIVERKTV